MPDSIKFTVNGKGVVVQTPGDRPLLDVLREDVHLTGTKYGCGEGACGACSVLLDDKRVFSCQVMASQAAGRSVTTIEGLAANDQLHPIQQAFLDHAAFQCGYCTPGMMVATAALLRRTPNPTDDQITQALSGNICRCCTYPRICQAVKQAAQTTTGKE